MTTSMVTGGAGFIGSALVRALLAGGQRVVTVDALTYAGRRETLHDIAGSPAHALVEADIRDHDAIEEAFATHRPDRVFHLAAESHVDRSIDAPIDFVTTNVTGTAVLLEAARQYWRRLDGAAGDRFRFVHVSTDEVYGSLGDRDRFTEATPPAPNTPYAASKAASDQLIRAWHKTYGLPVILSHCTNNYGPYQHPEKFVPLVILAVLERREIDVHGDGGHVRDWIHVDDHVRALDLIARRGVPGQTYNVGADLELTSIDLARHLCAILDEVAPLGAGRPASDFIRSVADRPGNDRRYAIDAGRLRGELGWAPVVGPDDGFRQTVEWYVKNRWWWSTLIAKNDIHRHRDPPRAGVALRV